MLDIVADIYLKLDDYLKYLKQAYALVTSGDLQSLVDKIDWNKVKLDKVLEVADKTGVLPSEVKKTLEQVNKYLPIKDLDFGAIKDFDTDKLKGHLVKGMKEFTVDRVNQQVGDKIGIDFRGLLMECAEGKKENCEVWVKQQMKGVVAKNMPKSASIAFNELMEGDLEAAATKTIQHNLQKLSGFQSFNVETLYQNLKDQNFEEAIKTIGKSQLYRFGNYETIAQKVIEGDTLTKEDMKAALKVALTDMGAKEIADYLDAGLDAYEIVTKNNLVAALKNGLQIVHFSPEAIEQFLKEGAKAAPAALFASLSNELGFSNPDAKAALMQGDIDKAIELQMQSGDIRPIDYAAVADKLKQYTTNRTILIRALHQLAKDSIKKKDIEDLLIQYRIQPSK